MAKKIIIGPRQLRAWANTYKDRDDAGTPRSGNYCPIAEYIRDNGGSNPHVSPEWISFYSPEEGPVGRRPTAFARKVMELVDATPMRREGIFNTGRVTIGMFKEILARIQEEGH